MARRFQKQEYQPPETLGARDYWEILFSLLVFSLGVVIVYREALEGFPLLGIVTGLAFLALGAYRLFFVVRYFSRRQQ